MDKSLAAVALYLATLKAGAAYHPLNPDYTQHELDYFLFRRPAAPDRCLAGARRYPSACWPDRYGARFETLDRDDGGSLARLAAAQSERHATVPRTGEDLAGLLYTSGTTGRPKGAMITHANLATNATALCRLWAFEPGDVLVHALPVFHVHGLHVALHTAFLGRSEILWLPKFDVGELMQCLESATVMMGVPTFYTRLLAEPSFGRSTCRTMRLFICGSAPLPAEIHAAFLRRTGHAILERYGMTEAGMIASNPYHGERVAGSVGFPLPDVAVRIADGEGREVPRGATGTIEVRGPNVFKGYWRTPAGTDFRADGFFVTGDLGAMAADGRISILGRARDLIISGGLNVYPKEVEAGPRPAAGHRGIRRHRRAPPRSRRSGHSRDHGCACVGFGKRNDERPWPAAWPASRFQNGSSSSTSCRAMSWARCKNPALRYVDPLRRIPFPANLAVTHDRRPGDDQDRRRTRQPVTGSFSHRTPRIIANKMLVSRSAATAPIGALGHGPQRDPVGAQRQCAGSGALFANAERAAAAATGPRHSSTKLEKIKQSMANTAAV